MAVILFRETPGMEKKPTNFNKVFGSGPIGLLISIVLFMIASWLSKQINLPISSNQLILNSIFFVSGVTTLVIIVWSVKSLPAGERGKKLCSSGAFKYVRHPLYAAFLSVFNFGLAVYLNSYIFVFWAALLHPIWHSLVVNEEGLMIDIFGETYREYRKTTGRFLPRLI
jgi:protein-S-isoprenylcysteine O-methyltransferase Ste14